MNKPVLAAPASNDDEGAARALIDAAGAMLRAERGEMPPGFVQLLFGRTAPEDLAGFEPRELAALAREAWAFFVNRKPGEAKIRFEAPPLESGTNLKTVSVIEVINDDMPFLVDSVMGELTERGLEIRLVAHPIIAVERDKTGKLVALPVQERGKAGATRESFIHIHVHRIEDAQKRAEIVKSIEQVLADVRLCVQDWRPMLARVSAVIADLKENPPPIPVDDIAEAIQFLEWLAGNNFTLLGVRDYALSKELDLKPVVESGLGILRGQDTPVLKRGGQTVTVTPQLQAFFNEPKTLIVTKANVKSRVHRRVYLDYIGVKRFDADGNPAGEFRIVGLFTSTAYTRSTRAIPYLRRKTDAIVQRAGFDPDTHSGKALTNVLESFPRDELFQIDEDTLYQHALAILQLEERPRVRVLARRDQYDRFVSILVFVPRERFDSRVRIAIGEYLAQTYHGHVSAFYPYFPSEGMLTRVHFIIGRDAGETPNPDRATLEEGVGAIVRTWTDALDEALSKAHDPAKANELFARYGEAFSDGYRELYSPLNAVEDIRVIESLSPERPIGVDFYHRVWDEKQCVGLKIWNHGRPIPLSERVPVLENMGFKVVDEQTYHVATDVPGEAGVWFHDMMLERADGGSVDLDETQQRLETCFIVVMRGVAENDGYNALVLVGGLAWRDVALVRTISRFLRQIRVPYSQDYMWATLRKHAKLAAKIVELFHARFDPRLGVSMEERSKNEAAIVAEIDQALGAVESLDEDRIVRRFVNAVQSAIRTNYYQIDKDGQPKQQIAIKFESRKLDGMPLPKPLYEIFVLSLIHI